MVKRSARTELKTAKASAEKECETNAHVGQQQPAPMGVTDSLLLMHLVRQASCSAQPHEMHVMGGYHSMHGMMPPSTMFSAAMAMAMPCKNDDVDDNDDNQSTSTRGSSVCTVFVEDEATPSEPYADNEESISRGGSVQSFDHNFSVTSVELTRTHSSSSFTGIMHDSLTHTSSADMLRDEENYFAMPFSGSESLVVDKMPSADFVGCVSLPETPRNGHMHIQVMAHGLLV